MKQALIYLSITGERFVYRGGYEKTKCLICSQSLGRCADKPTILYLYEEKDMNKENIAQKLYKLVKAKQLKEFQERMPSEKKGVEFEYNGKKYIAAIRRLTPLECAKLQTVPSSYEFVTSETQQYRCLGNGWTIEVIKHIFSFLPEKKKKHLKVLSLFDGMSGGATCA